MEYISPFAMGDPFTDIGFVLFVGQGTGGLPYRSELVDGIVPIVNGLFRFPQYGSAHHRPGSSTKTISLVKSLNTIRYL